ncbi:hypothetical protein DAI22_11g236800 [Oryza sativa Japonica Group]|nr:hypothetical protein DAI22_11g236800 [Oryza sativa Japonica Group]
MCKEPMQPGIDPDRLLLPMIRRRNEGVWLNRSFGTKPVSLERFPMVAGMPPNMALWPRSRSSRRCSLPMSSGNKPVRPVLVRLRTERKDRLPRWELSSPCRGTFGSSRATTRC